MEPQMTSRPTATDTIDTDPDNPTRDELLERFNFAASDIDPETRAEVDRRASVLAPSYNLFYSRPVEVSSSEGAYMFGSDGTRYLDMYNNIPAVGHANPRVTAAVAEQMAVLNTHTRYLYPSLADYGTRLLATMPPPVDRLFLTNSGSEANDLAVRIARTFTGNTGVIVTKGAYHGSAGYADAISPISRIVSNVPDPEWVRTVAAPDPYREGPAAAARFASDVDAAIDDLNRQGFRIAALFMDMVLSTDGVIPGPLGVFEGAIERVRSSGGIFVADEVQSGFGRLGDGMWGFSRHGIEPDLVTMGKPMGNGFPVAGLAGREPVFAAFARKASYFNTFGGSPVAVAAATAVLDEIEDHQLIARSKEVGTRLIDGLHAMKHLDPGIGDVRGSGLFVAVEYVTDRSSKLPDAARALEIVTRCRDRGVLISNTGTANNSLKIRPPLVIDEAGIDEFLSVFTALSAEHR